MLDNDECEECGDSNVGECGNCDEHCICEEEFQEDNLDD